MKSGYLSALNKLSPKSYSMSPDGDCLISSDGQRVRIERDIPVFIKRESSAQTDWQKEQDRTAETFSAKWSKYKTYGFEGQLEFQLEWSCKKLGLRDVAALKRFYQNKHTILEVGPGSGFNSHFMGETNPDAVVFAADISDGAFTTAENCAEVPNVFAMQADLMALPFRDEVFDFIIADGVLHHTPDTKAAVFALFKKLAYGGQFFFYIYKKMSPIKQFSDSYIREAFSKLGPEECIDACRAITELGRALSSCGKIHIEHEIPILGIPSGDMSVQRLVYYNFVKCFWNDDFDFETNNMINFDWFHPHDAWQYTEEEVRQWMDELGVADYQINDANPNGISVLLTK